MKRYLPLSFALFAIALFACGDDTPPSSSGPSADTGEMGSIDAGFDLNFEDTGPADTGQADTGQADTGTEDEPDVTEELDLPVDIPQMVATTLEFSVSADTIGAGAPLGYVAQVLDDGEPSEDLWEIDITSDPADGVTVEDTALIFTSLGLHTLTATATLDERDDLTATATVTVTHGSLGLFQVTATPDPVTAGELVTFELYAEDVAGNELDVATLGVTFTLVAPVVEVPAGDRSTTITVAGRYEVHAMTSDGVTEADIFHVVPGAPENLVFTIEDYSDVTLGQGVGYTVTVTDKYGNVVRNAPISMYTDPDGARITSKYIIFEEEGIFWVYVEVADTDLMDSAGPIVVDVSAPRIELTTPPRGIHLTGQPLLVSGTVTDNVTGLATFTINGQSIDVDEDGSFSTTVPADDLGVNLLFVEATDSNGNDSDIAQSYLYGTEWVDAGTGATDGMVARLNEAALGFFEDSVGDLFDADTIAEQIEGVEVFNIKFCTGFEYDGGNKCCFGVLVRGFCIGGNIGFVDFAGTVSSVDIGSFDIALDAVGRDPAGFLEIAGNLTDVVVDIAVTGDITFTVFADLASIDVVLEATPKVPETGTLEVDLVVPNDGVSSTCANPCVGISGAPSWVNSLISAAVESTVKSQLETQLAAQIVAIAPQINELLKQLAINIAIPEFGLTFSALPQKDSVFVDDDGMTLVLESTVSADTPGAVQCFTVDLEGASSEIACLGSLLTQNPIPSYTTDNAFILSLSDDFVNQMFYALWEADLIANLLGGATDTIDLSFLSLLVPNATDFEIELDPLLPPVFRPGSVDNGQGEVQIGDILLGIYGTRESGRELLMQIAMSMFVDMDISVDETNNLSFGFAGEPELYIDGVVSTVQGLDENAMANLIEAIVPIFLGDLFNFSQSFPLPAFAGYAISVDSIVLAGPEMDYVNVEGALAPVE